MAKDTTYTLRINSKLKEALAVAAKKDRRTISSLLEKIIVDYLEKVGIEWEEEERKKRGRKH
jgi:predicted HicB family RNase H-like nuclease